MENNPLPSIIFQVGKDITSQTGNKNKSAVNYNRQIKIVIKKEKRKSFVKGLFSGLLINLLWYIIQRCFL